jgi:hypothetical protein
LFERLEFLDQELVLGFVFAKVGFEKSMVGTAMGDKHGWDAKVSSD